MPFGFQQVPWLKCLHRFGASLCLCLVLAVAGCSYIGPARPHTLHQLHVPHLRWLPALSRIPQADGTHGGIIYGLTTFQRAGIPSTQVILDLNGVLQMIGIDSTGWHPLNMGEHCLHPGAVTNDGQWIACVSSPNHDNGSDRLQVAMLHSTGTSQIQQIQLSASPFYDYLTWSPDGQYVAVVLRDVGLGCSVTIFASPPPHLAFTPAVNLASAQFSDQYEFCDIDNILWSVDGQRLFVLGAGGTIFLATVAVTKLFQAFDSTPPDYVVNLEIPSDEMETFTFANVRLDRLQLFMDPQRDAVLYTAWGPSEQLISFDLHTHQSADLFTLPADYQISALTWMPDGRQLLMSVGDFPCVDCGQYAISDVYLYSPDA